MPQTVVYTLFWICETAAGQYRRVAACLETPLEEAASRLTEALVGLAPAGEEEQGRAAFGELAARIAARSAAAVGREGCLEVHLPCLDRRQWRHRWEALARVEVEVAEDGRLLAYSLEGQGAPERKHACQCTLALCWALPRALAGEPLPEFTLGFSDRRRVRLGPGHLETVLRGYGLEGHLEEWRATLPVAADDEVEVSLTLSLPGGAVRAWLEAPSGRDPDYFHTYAAVSLAVQRALRRWLPYLYFSDSTRYDDLLAAWPLLVYQAMPPFPGRPKYEFTYDVVDVGARLLRRHSTLKELTARLARLRPHLTALGRHKTARFYDPDDAASILTGVARQPRLLNALLAAEACFVEALLELGLRAHALTGIAARNPARAASELARFAGDFISGFHRRLRRLYAGRDFLPLGTLLLMEATRALCAVRARSAPLAAHLRLGRG